MKTSRFIAAVLSATLIASVPAFAEDKPSATDPQSLASEGVQNLMRAMELLMMSIPQFEAPFMNENGDIIIRRKNPKNPPDKPEEDSPKGESGKAI